MEKEFVLYEEALALKELGLDDPCVFYVNKNNESFIYNFQTHPDEFIEWCGGNVIKAPTYSQAFRWFREKHNISSYVDYYKNGNYENIWYFIIKTKDHEYQFDGSDLTEYCDEPYYKNHEEAELACLKKLIELVKQTP